MARLLPESLWQRVQELWHPQEIWLFGSRATGRARADSDWDVLLVLPDSTPEELLDPNTAWLRVRDLKIPVDLFPMRRSEFEEERRQWGSLAQIATSEGTRADA